jgi:hypothetical protein
MKIMKRRFVVTTEFSQIGHGFVVKGRNQIELACKMQRILGRFSTGSAHRWKHWPVVKTNGGSVGKVFKDY